MQVINDILKTSTGKKMIASLSYFYETEIKKGRLSEYNWISELPKKQQELFDTIYQLLDYSQIELAFKLINGRNVVKKS